MLDPQVDAVRAMVDETAERIATLGVVTGRDARRARRRRGRGTTTTSAGPARIDHLGALEVVYTGVIESHRKAIDATEDPDPVTQDMLIGQAGQLELFHWFVRAHLESSRRRAVDGRATHEQTAAKKAGARQAREVAVVRPARRGRSGSTLGKLPVG